MHIHYFDWLCNGVGWDRTTLKVIMQKLTNQLARRNLWWGTIGSKSFGNLTKTSLPLRKAFCRQSSVSFYCKSAIQVWWNRHYCNIHANDFISSNHYIQAWRSSFYSGFILFFSISAVAHCLGCNWKDTDWFGSAKGSWRRVEISFRDEWARVWD